MPTIVWACPLVEVREAFMPKVVAVLDSIAPHETSWSTTSGARTAPYAVGCSVVSVEQQTALEGDSAILLWTEEDWQRQFDQLPQGIRTRLNQFCTNVGITRPMNNEVLRDVLSRMTALIDNKLMEHHVVQVQRQQAARRAT